MYFFGHSNTSSDVNEALRAVITELIEVRGVSRFYVGNHGDFDRIVTRVLQECAAVYLHIRYAVVLAYYPHQMVQTETPPAEETVFPEEVACAPKRYAIIRRNQWMIDRADYVVTCVWDTATNAAEFKEMAMRKQKIVIELTERQ